jgi:hypothetical protein
MLLLQHAALLSGVWQARLLGSYFPLLSDTDPVIAPLSVRLMTSQVQEVTELTFNCMIEQGVLTRAIEVHDGSEPPAAWTVQCSPPPLPPSPLATSTPTARKSALTAVAACQCLDGTGALSCANARAFDKSNLGSRILFHYWCHL